RAFHDENVVHVDEQADPKRDIEVINTELVLADLQTVEKRLPRLEKEVRANPKLRPALETLQRAHKLLDDGKPISSAGLEAEELEQLADLQLLTAKPVLYLFNVDE